MAFIIDIRRQNMMQHLMYKAIIEMSDDRADFMSRLFSRPRPGGMTRTTTAADMLAAYGRMGSSEAMFQKNLAGCPEPAGEAARVSAFDRGSPQHRVRVPGVLFRRTGAPVLLPAAAGGRALVSDLRRADDGDGSGRQEPQLRGNRGELPGAARVPAQQPAGADRRRFRRRQGDPGGGPVPARAGRDRELLSTRRTWSSTSFRTTRGSATTPTSRRCRSTTTARSSARTSIWDSAFRPGSSRPTCTPCSCSIRSASLLSAFRAGEFRSYDEIVARTKF